MLFDAGAIAIAAKRSRLWGVPEAGAVPSTPFVLAVQVLVLVFFISGLLFFIYLLFLGIVPFERAKQWMHHATLQLLSKLTKEEKVVIN